MKSTLVLWALALVEPITAAPKHSYGGGASSQGRALGSQTKAPYVEVTGKPWSKPSDNKSPWGQKSPKKHYKSKSSEYSGKSEGFYPTMQPNGGYEGPSTGMNGGTGTAPGPTYSTSATQPQPTGGNTSGNNGGNDGGNNGGSSQTYVSGSPTGSPTGASSTDTGGGSSSVPSTFASSGNGSVVSSGGISLPAGCQTKSGIGIGWLPGTSETIGDIESALGVTTCFDGQYGQITGTGPYTDSSNQLLPSLTQIVGGKTIFVASLMPSIALSSVDSTVAGGVANVMKQFTDKGIEVWLRFAHEMNWYVTDGTYKGSSSDFQQAWAAISSAVESNDQVKMFWSPNEASAATIESGGWFPTSGKVDLVGIDIYPNSQKTFGQVYGDFCKTFSIGKNIPFAIGETGAGPDIKQYWLGQLAEGDKSACPNYVGFSWFDYNKEQDFEVVGGGSTIAKQVLG